MTEWWALVLAACGTGCLVATAGLLWSHWPEPERLPFEPEAPIRALTFDEYCERTGADDELFGPSRPTALAAYIRYLDEWDGTIQPIKEIQP